MNGGRFLLRPIAGILSILLLGLIGPAERANDHPQRIVFTAADSNHRGIELVRHDSFSYVPYERADMLDDAKATANFIVNYSGFTPQAQAAFQYAVNIWADIVVSNVPIRVDARFSALGGNTLGQAGPGSLWGNFPNSRPNTFYVDAIADKLTGQDVCGLAGCAGDPDIEAEFNSNPPVPWYFGLDARPPSGTVDFVSVVLHELGHGLGFIGSGSRNSAGLGVWGVSSPPTPISFDRFVRTGTGKAFISNPTPSSAALADLTGNNLFFTTPVIADGASISSPARLYAPSTFQPGSTYSHLDESTYPTGSTNALMTPQITTAEANHNPGPVTREIFTDIGWGPTGAGPSPGGAPGKPTVTQAQASGGILTVAWTLAAGASPTSHRLDFFSGNTPVATVNAGPNTSIAIPIPPGTNGSFTVRVTAFNGNTAGPISDPFGFTIGTGCIIPGAPQVTGGVVGGTASVQWPQVPGAASYILSAGTLQGGTNLFPTTNIGSNNFVSASGLPAGFQAWVRVIAVNPCGQQGPATDFLVR